MKQVFPVLMLMMLCVGTLTFAIEIQPARAAGTIVVPDDYSTIQDAINHASAGDTIYVRNGIYQEQIEVNKTVKLTGESNQNTIIVALRGAHFRFGVDISANNSIVENFRIVPPNSTESKEIPALVLIDGRTAPCSNDTVRNCVLVFATDVEAGSDAIDVDSAANNTVTGNLITIADKTDAGIAVAIDSAGNLIDNNTITGGWEGIAIEFADNNILSNNYITDQTPWSQPDSALPSGAVYLDVTSGDTIKGNTFVNNTIAINSDSQVDNCLIYNNNFINNTQQALVGNTVTRLAWDDGYPSGGNYWSDYNGTDVYYGPGQNETGGDGIGDTPYVIDGSNIDHYPFVNPLVFPSTILVGDLNLDGKLNHADLAFLASAYNSKPGDPNWNPMADLAAPFGIIGLTDLVTMAIHYGQHNP